MASRTAADYVAPLDLLLVSVPSPPRTLLPRLTARMIDRMDELDGYATLGRGRFAYRQDPLSLAASREGATRQQWRDVSYNRWRKRARRVRAGSVFRLLLGVKLPRRHSNGRRSRADRPAVSRRRSILLSGLPFDVRCHHHLYILCTGLLADNLPSH